MAQGPSPKHQSFAEDYDKADSSQEPSTESSAAPSRSTSQTRDPDGGERRVKERPRVRFTPGGESLDHRNQRSTFDVRDRSRSAGHEQNTATKAPLLQWSPSHSRNSSAASASNTLNRMFPNLDTDELSTDITESPARSPVPKPRPLLIRHGSANSDFDDITEEGQNDDQDDEEEKAFSQLSAQERAQRLSLLVGSHSAPGSRRTSTSLEPESPPPSGPRGLPVGVNDIPLLNLNKEGHIDEDTDDDEEAPAKGVKEENNSMAHRLIRRFTKAAHDSPTDVSAHASELRSGQVTPVEERDPYLYVPPPDHYRGGVLSSLLKLHKNQGLSALASDQDINTRHFRQGSSGDTGTSTPGGTPRGSPDSSGRTTPKRKHQKWYYKNHSANHSTSSLTALMGSSSMLAAPAGGHGGVVPKVKRPAVKRGHSTGMIGSAMSRMSKPRLEDEIRITVHIAETLSRQKYLLKLCRALMSYGAPTHRLEEYMRMSARVLEIDGQFLYIPGCMIMSFDDASTHTTEVKIVRSTQGVDLGKLRDTHEIYKEVVHDVIGVEEATQRLDEVLKRKQKHPAWLLVFVYGLASACVGPFAFKARFIDLPIAFFLGCLLGTLQLIIAPRSELYSNVFEISAAVLTSFLARAFGSIPGNPFCFSALAQSSIALILPGYTVLCGSLELQSRSIVAGSVRMVYAIIYSLFLGFGITIGTAIYGLFDQNATSETTCSSSMPEYYGFIFVPLFTVCLIVINQAKWKQAPVMIIIAFAGYVVNFFSAKRFSSNAQIANTLGAFAVGVLGNLYSRLRHGLAAAALLPAIFVQVPSGLAASGSLISGITSANQITANATGNTTVSSATNVYGDTNTTVFNVGYSMVQVAIVITVGLFLSALVVYPFGKRRSGLFSF
ncbi:MAG: hypothetical protein M1827_004419 [Pycnora praestabilis]|nr:MAG: hypothetical protein M1827_004419 [Pycnora praestabilis]